jgi:hypothetical protein
MMFSTIWEDMMDAFSVHVSSTPAVFTFLLTTMRVVE